jgi:hypothetical protein
MLLGCFLWGRERERERERERGGNDGEKGEAGGYGEREWGGKKEKKNLEYKF